MRARSILLRVAVATSTIAALTLGAGLPAHAAPPELQVNDVTVTEGNAGTSFATFTIDVRRAGPSGVSPSTTPPPTRRATGAVTTRPRAGHGCAAERRLQVPPVKRPDHRRHHRGAQTKPSRCNLSTRSARRSRIGQGPRPSQRRSPSALDDRRPPRRRERRTMTFTGVARRVIADRRGHDLRTAAGTATAGSDFTATTGTLTVRRVRPRGTIDVPVLDDSGLRG